jgi:hypothetical protein
MSWSATTNKGRKSVQMVVMLLGVSVSARYAQASNRPVPEGVWGGEHLRLEVSAKGAALEYDCAHGTIERPLVLDARGRFLARGTHAPERGGPTSLNGRPVATPVRYAGIVKGDTMTLTVRLERQKQPLGVFTLIRGTEPLLMKCR